MKIRYEARNGALFDTAEEALAEEARYEYAQGIRAKIDNHEDCYDFPTDTVCAIVDVVLELYTLTPKEPT